MEWDNIDYAPTPLEDYEGGFDTLKQRVIIVYDNEQKESVAKMLGLDDIKKIIYIFDELPI